MKNVDVLVRYQFATDPKLATIAAGIKSTKLQWHRGNNLSKLEKGVKQIHVALNEMKSEKLKTMKPDDEGFRDEIKKFEAQENVLELLEIESEVTIKTVTIDDLPSDLTDMELGSVRWMMENDEF